MNQKNKNKEKEDEGCPLCKISEQAFQKLNIDKGAEVSKKPSSSKKGFFFMGLIIIVALFAVYKLQTNHSFEANSQKQKSLVTIATENNAPKIGYPAPDFTSEDVLGNKIALSDFRGQKPVLLVFWATWCNICAQELEDLKTFTSKHQGHIQVLAVDSGEPKETLKNYIQEKNINFLMLLDEKREIWNQYLARGTPSHFLVDQEGKIFTVRPGLASLSDLETILAMLPPKKQ